MELIVEIGTEEQRKQIKEELFLFTNLIKKLNLTIGISQLIVPNDFDKKVNQFQKTSNYKSQRGLNSTSITAMAKIIDVDTGCVIIFSPLLFTEEHDSQTRYFIYFHELIHAINKQKLPSLSTESLTINTYKYNIYHLFDEYYSDRYSYTITEKCFTAPSKLWQNYLKNEINGFKSIINDQKYYDHITDQILRFRLYQINVDEFIENIKPVFDIISLTIVHTFALIDQYPDFNYTSMFNESHFINNKTFELMEYFRKKYEQNNFDLDDGMNLILKFIKNFGIQFVDTDQGLYCHILNV